MKLSLTAVALALTAPLAMALPLEARATCPLNALSCSSTAGGSCCSPTNGLLILVQQWIPGWGPSDGFTLHGLWPDTCSGGQTGSSGCDSSRQYTGLASIVQSYNSTLYNEMTTYWPSYTGDNDAFWTHEWDKHGTCVSTLAPACYTNYQKYEDVNDYFGKAIALRAQYDLYQVLSAAGITPGGSYDVSEFENAIEQAYGVVPNVNCKSGTLSEIWLYFNVKNTNTYVPTDTVSSSSCSGTVDFPTK
ncbi:RNase Sy [Gongronella butleri]|nr:RNase Sy [Gongronella butleri]